MNPKCSVFIATSLDGFIARPNGSIDWLEKENKRVPPGEDFGYVAFMATVDALVMGRHTYEQVCRFPEWPYGELAVHVLTHHPDQLSPRKTVRFSSESPADLVARLGREGRTHLYVDGGRTIQEFLAAGLVSEVTLTTIPILLGEGRGLFGPLPGDRSLELLTCRSWPCGFVQAHWRVLFPKP